MSPAPDIFKRLFAALPANQRRRLLAGAGVNVFSQVITATLTLVSLPLLLRAWGASQYGLWVLIGALPAYLAISDLGFGWAATGRMTAAVGSGDYRTARRCHQTLIGITLGSVAILSCMVVLGAATINGSYLPGGGLIEPQRMRIAIGLLMFNALISLSLSTITSSWRANGAYPTSVIYGDLMRILEAALVVAVALSGGDVMAAAAASFAARAIGFFCMILITPRLVPWVSYSLAEFSVHEISLLWRPALAALCLPLGFALNVQGMTILVGSTLGLASLATFTAVRTLTRLVIQVMGILGNAAVPEIGRAIGAKDTHALHSIVFGVLGLGLAAGLLFITGTALLGQVALSRFTHDAIHVSVMFLTLFSFAAVLQGLWNTASNILLGANMQAAVAYLVLTVSGLGLLAAYFVAPVMGLTGIVVVMCTTEAALLILVGLAVRRFLRRSAA